MNIKNQLKLTKNIISYNLKIVFANKFVYFFIAAIAFYLIVTAIMLFSDAYPEEEDIYSTLIFPGILIIFYPVLFNIQNDKDARMLEIIFGIPNYRYKVYLIRFIISIGVLFVLLVFMAWFTHFSVVPVPVFSMVFQLMFPLIFLASVSFLFSSLLKNGRGAAVVMVITGLVFLFLSESLGQSKWSIFLNPFYSPTDMSHSIWMGIVYQNRVILIIGSIISLLWTMINLQKRESFV